MVAPPAKKIEPPPAPHALTRIFETPAGTAQVVFAVNLTVVTGENLHTFPAAHSPGVLVPMVQVEPRGLAVPSTHTAVPLVHEMTPLKQLPPGLVVHDAPAVQALQPPAPLQTPPVHEVPAALGTPVLFVHTAVPLLHWTMPA